MVTSGFSRRGYSLIEVLIAVAVIALLISLSIPAIQASREAARRTQCTNNLRQFGVAFSGFEAQNKAFPSSLTMRFEGPLETDPGFAVHDYYVDLLPFLEETGIEAQYDKKALFCAPANAAVVSKRLPIAICPSAPDRSESQTLEFVPSLRLPSGGRALFGKVYDALDRKYTFKYQGAPADYAVPEQVEDGLASQFGYDVPKNAPMGLPSMFPLPLSVNLPRTIASLSKILKSPGTVELRYQTRAEQVTDGLSRTMMMTEVAGRPQHWEMGARTSRLEPLASAWADPSCALFNIRGIQTETDKCVLGCANTSESDGEIYSFHSGGVNFVFADAHVEFINADTDPRLVLALVTPNGSDNDNAR